MSCTVSILPPPGTAQLAPIAADGWLPAIDPNTLRAAAGLGTDVTDARLIEAIEAAILTVAGDPAVDAWTNGQAAKGYASLGDVPAPTTINGRSSLVVAYGRAISCFARAELTERLRRTGMSPTGDRATADLTDSVDDLRRDGRYAVRDLIGRGRTTIELL